MQSGFMMNFHVFTKREFEVDGEQKARWYRVGFLKETERGGRFLRLYAFPETTFYVFPQEDETETSDQ